MMRIGMTMYGRLGWLTRSRDGEVELAVVVAAAVGPGADEVGVVAEQVEAEAVVADVVEEAVEAAVEVEEVAVDDDRTVPVQTSKTPVPPVYSSCIPPHHIRISHGPFPRYDIDIIIDQQDLFLPSTYILIRDLAHFPLPLPRICAGLCPNPNLTPAAAILPCALSLSSSSSPSDLRFSGLVGVSSAAVRPIG